MRWSVTIAAILVVCGGAASAQDTPPESATSGLAEAAAKVFELFGKPVHPTLEPIAPTAGLTAGIALTPAPWRNEARLKMFSARASISTRTYWAIDGSFAWQQSNAWRLEPYARARSMKRLNHFGLGNDSAAGDRADFALVDRHVGVYGWRRPVPWLALGGRAEGLWPQSSSGQSADLRSVEEVFTRAALPGFEQATTFTHVQAFANVNYPAGRNERSRRGGDYAILFGTHHDLSGHDHSFRRLEIEGQERFPIFGRDRQLTLHARLSTSTAFDGHTVPFYMMETLGGADNLRGFREDVIGSDQTTATLRAFESFRFRDATSALAQAEFRQRLWSQVFVSVFADTGMVATSVDRLALSELKRGFGVALSVYRANVMAVRVDFAWAGGEGGQHFITPGKAFGF